MLIQILKLAGFTKNFRFLGKSLISDLIRGTAAQTMQYPRVVSGGGPPPRRPYVEDYNNYSYEPPPVQGMWAGQGSGPRRPVSVTCGELRASDRGQLVHMTGRVQYQRLNRFISLRDSHGTTQLVAMEERMDLIKRVRNIPIDSHIEIIGTVNKRPLNTVNSTMATGEIEVVVDEILDVSSPKRKMFELSGEEAPGRTGKKARSSVLITSGEIARCETEAVKRKFHQRTHNCGELNESYVNANVSLCGWIESKRNDRFVLMRDGYGAAQLVINPMNFACSKVMQSAEQNTLVTVKGRVCLRPQHQRNTRMATGSIEVKVDEIDIIDPNEPVASEGNTPVSGQANAVTADAQSSAPAPGDVNSYTYRSHNCGQLRGSDVGKDVVLCGWLDSQRTNRFGIIRDGHGSTQLLVPSGLEESVGKVLGQTPLESVIMVVGTVCARPPEQVTEKLSTGEIEVVLKEFVVLNPSKKDLPFIIRDFNRPKENVRMKYRYLDMRYSDMQYRLRLRSAVLMKMREFLINQRGFVEVETPTLFRRTPGGAQEYVVPTRMQDRFYSLVQSPQQLKQLLMVGAVDRYFQVARCYRDEGARPDRQPEFTQMDIELSFTDRDSIMSLVEDLLRASWPADMKPLSTPFTVLTYHDAMHGYGSDKPDLSFDKKLVDISKLIEESGKQENIQTDLNVPDKFTAKVLVFGPNDIQKLNRAFESCREVQQQKSWTRAKLSLVKCSLTRWRENVSKAMPYVDPDTLKSYLDLTLPCSVVVGIGHENQVLPLMGKLRQDVFGCRTPNFHFAWIVDFPLFLEGDDGNLESAHHPFTQVNSEDQHLLDSDPLKARGLHFDLVLNGFEVGGGSVRIHDAAVQRRVLQDMLKIPVDTLEHLLEALGSGAPPHGGIALGMDRLLSIMVGAESIREVIAFPKGVDGKDPLSGAPCAISDDEKRLYHLTPTPTSDGDSQ